MNGWLNILCVTAAVLVVVVYFWDERLRHPIRMYRELRATPVWLVILVVAALLLLAILNLDGVILSN